MTHHPIPDPPVSSPKRSPVRLGLLTLASLIVVGGVLYWPLREPAPAPAQAASATGIVSVSAEAQAVAGITVEPVRVTMLSPSVEAIGLLALDESRTSRIGSVVEGVVVETFHEVGDRIDRGALLANLHSHSVHDAWAAYRKATAERRRVTTELAFKQDAARRAERLLVDKAVAPQDVERARVDVVSAEEALSMAQSEVRRSEEELQHLGVTNGDDPTGEAGEFVPSRAPISGVVLERSVSSGTAVTPGTQMFVVSNLSSLWALVEVDEVQLPVLRVGMPVTLKVSAYPGETFPATVAFVGDSINDKTHRVPVRCVITNRDGRLKPHMFATVSLDSGVPRQSVVVPSAALQEMEGRTVVFVQRADKAFERRDVSAGPERDGTVEIRSGLRDGDRVATNGSFLLKSQLLTAASGTEN